MTANAPLEELASRLLSAERSRTATSPLTEQYPDLSMQESYQVQRLRVEASSECPVGYKLGFTSDAMRRQMGISSPNYGVLTHEMEAKDGRINLSGLIHPRIEPEIALITGERIFGESVTAKEVRNSVRRACATIEVVDSRFVDYLFSLEDNTADNSSAARFVLGEPFALKDVPELNSIPVSVHQDEQEIATGVGSAAMGDPFEALAWLVRALGAEQKELAAGSIVLSGGLTQAYPVSGPSVFTADSAGLGRVKACFE